MASDFALPRFRNLQKLLLVHGHWCYSRLANMILYFFYKNAVRRRHYTRTAHALKEQFKKNNCVLVMFFFSLRCLILGSDVRGAHLLVSVLLRLLGLVHDRPVVSDLLQPDVLRLPATHHRHARQGRVGPDAAATTSALRQRTELGGGRLSTTSPL